MTSLQWTIVQQSVQSGYFILIPDIWCLAEATEHEWIKITPSHHLKRYLVNFDAESNNFPYLNTWKFTCLPHQWSATECDGNERTAWTWCDQPGGQGWRWGYLSLSLTCADFKTKNKTQVRERKERKNNPMKISWTRTQSEELEYTEGKSVTVKSGTAHSHW